MISAKNPEIIRSGRRIEIIAAIRVGRNQAGEAESVKLAWRPQVRVDVAEADAQTLFKLIDALDDDDDVQTVWGNYEVSDAVMESLG